MFQILPTVRVRLMYTNVVDESWEADPSQDEDCQLYKHECVSRSI